MYAWPQNACIILRTRPPSPLLDFMGEKIGPKRSKKSSSGSSKRGRPRGTKRGLDREEQQRIAAQVFWYFLFSSPFYFVIRMYQ